MIHSRFGLISPGVNSRCKSTTSSFIRSKQDEVFGPCYPNERPASARGIGLTTEPPGEFRCRANFVRVSVASSTSWKEHSSFPPHHREFRTAANIA